MRSIVAACLLVAACSGSSKPASPAAKASHCDEYAITVDGAQRTPPTAGDDVEAEAVSACGCPSTFHTTAAAAAMVHDAYVTWTGAGCGPIACDTPCSAMP